MYPRKFAWSYQVGLVYSRLWGVHNEVSEREAKALSSAAQEQGLGPRPGETLLILW